MEKIKIGVAPTKRDIFSVDDAHKYKTQIYEKLKSFDCDVLDAEDICENGLLSNEKDVELLAKKFADVDGLFIPHCDFGSEGLVSRLGAKLKKPVLLWGPSDDLPLPDGTITRYTQCGIFATGKVLQRFNVPYTYIVNSSVTSDKFTNGFKRFLRVCNTVKAFYSTRILQISTRPQPFWSVMANEGELLERFGIEISPITLYDLQIRMEKVLKEANDPNFEKAIKRLGQMDCSEIGSEEEIKKIAALKTALKRLCEEKACNVVALQCWDAMQGMMGIMPCMSNGLLTEEGIPAICETDIHGAISARLLSAAAANKTIFLSDITMRHPEVENMQLLWHCGNFSPELAENISEAKGKRNLILPSKCPGVGSFALKEGNLTLARFDGVNGEYKLMIGQARAVKGPKASGTYVWVEVPDLDLWEYKLVTGPYIHHCAGVYDEVAAVLHEACKYIPKLQPEPIQPTAEEIFQTWLKG